LVDPLAPLRLAGTELGSGLRITRQVPPVGAASCSITYVGPAGWGYDPPGRQGLARMVNQVMTSATSRLDRVELARWLDRAGASLSHQTAPESGEVTIWGPAAEWERLLGMLADVVLRPRFDREDLERARRQFREAQLREAGQPANRAERELLRAVFPRDHPYAATGIGSSSTVGRITPADLRRFLAEHYTSGSAHLVVTAPPALPSVERTVRRAFRELPSSAPAPLRPSSLRDRRGSEVRVDLPGRTQVEVRLAGTSIARQDATYPAAFLANETLGGRPLLSRLFQRVREQEGLAYHASSSLEAMRLGGYWIAQAGTGAQRWRRVVRLLRGEVARLDRESVPPEELDAVRQSAIGEIPLALESTVEAHELAVDVAYHGLDLDYWATWPDVLRSVRPPQVREAASVALDGRGAVTVLAGPLEGK
jgi:zinc protease